MRTLLTVAFASTFIVALDAPAFAEDAGESVIMVSPSKTMATPTVPVEQIDAVGSIETQSIKGCTVAPCAAPPSHLKTH